MKTLLFLYSLCALAIGVMAQTPLPTATAPTPAASVSLSSPAATVAPTPSDEENDDRDIDQQIEKKLKKHFNFAIGHDGADAKGHNSHDDEAWMAVPIVAIIFFAIFGAPVAIVAIVMLINWSKSRALHRTIRTMVEKGQPVPPELFASPAATQFRPWYDLRRGIILLAVGVGLVIFFGVSAGWDVGTWALGLIPAIIGAGYILTWRLAHKQQNLLKP
ncbi:MAG: DUF6249 domain-containing protein [Verrucomicrobiota bacterium]|nr:DUF6249 domain-containing protein [Verrucomicrobiota bacterium]